MIRTIFGFFALLVLALLILIGWTAWQQAHAQLQGGPNISPNGIPFTFSPRFGYIGPPAVFVPPPPPRTRYYVPGNTVVIPIPRDGIAPPAGPPPVPPLPPPATRGPRDPKSPALRLPKGPRPDRPEVPCPSGCERDI